MALVNLDPKFSRISLPLRHGGSVVWCVPGNMTPEDLPVGSSHGFGKLEWPLLPPSNV